MFIDNRPDKTYKIQLTTVMYKKSAQQTCHTSNFLVLLRLTRYNRLRRNFNDELRRVAQ